MKKHNCQDIEPLLPATAAGALDFEEHSDIQAHLAECGFCKRKLHEYEETVVLLAYTVPQVQPPLTLRSQIISIAVSSSAVDRGVAQLPFQPRASGTPEPAQREAQRSGSLAHLLGGFYRRVAPAGLALSVVLLVVTATSMVAMFQQMNVMAATVSDTATMKRVLARDGATRMDLKPMVAVAKLSGQVIMAPGENQVVVVANHLPTPAADHVYRLWMLKKSGETIAAGDLTVDSNGVSMCSVDVPMDPSTAAGVAVSEEPVNGGDTPDGPVVLEGWK